jgi:very-short-patch-repair endonuclease
VSHALRMTAADVKAHQERVKGKPKAESAAGHRGVSRSPTSPLELDPDSGLRKAGRTEVNATQGVNLRPADSASRPDDQYEQWLYNQLVAAGVLGIERQYFWCRGRKYRADLAIPSPHRLIIELEGGVHTIRKRWRDDVIKGQQAILQGWVLLRIANDQVRSGDAARIVQNVLITLMAQRAPF